MTKPIHYKLVPEKINALMHECYLVAIDAGFDENEWGEWIPLEGDYDFVIESLGFKPMQWEWDQSEYGLIPGSNGAVDIRDLGYGLLEDVELALTQEAYLCGTHENAFYRANAIGSNGDAYTVEWEIVNHDCSDFSEACDWDEYTVKKSP